MQRGGLLIWLISLCLQSLWNTCPRHERSCLSWQQNHNPVTRNDPNPSPVLHTNNTHKYIHARMPFPETLSEASDEQAKDRASASPSLEDQGLCSWLHPGNAHAQVTHVIHLQIGHLWSCYSDKKSNGVHVLAALNDNEGAFLHVALHWETIDPNIDKLHMHRNIKELKCKIIYLGDTPTMDLMSDL